MISLDERGKQCPIPIVDTKKAVEPLGVGEVVETVVDNEISAQNLKKFADQRQYAYEMEKVSDTEYRVRLTVTEAAKELQDKGTATFNEQDYQACGIPAAAPQGYIVVISSDSMGEPEKELGKILLKGFLFALSKKEDVPKKIIFYLWHLPEVPEPGGQAEGWRRDQHVRNHRGTDRPVQGCEAVLKYAE